MSIVPPPACVLPWPLRYLDGQTWRVLPPWAQFLIQIGASFVDWSAEDQLRFVGGISLPTRAFASMLVGAGVVLERAPKIQSQGQADAEYFEYLCGLKPETALLFKHEGRILNAVFDGVTSLYDELRIKVRVQKKSSGGGTHLVGQRNVGDIEVIPEVNGEGSLRQRLPKKASKDGASRKDFIESLLDSDSSDFLLRPRFECLFVGNVGLLRHEIHKTGVGVPTSGIHEGTFQDILRVRKFMSDGKPYRSDVTSSAIKPASGVLSPFVVIFDGAQGFLKWRDDFASSHWIVVLDRTEPHFREAANLLNGRYIQYRVNAQPLGLPTIEADSIEISAHKEVFQ
jgi:hypothetical protein